jgi:hypothetical protein
LVPLELIVPPNDRANANLNVPDFIINLTRLNIPEPCWDWLWAVKEAI